MTQGNARPSACLDPETLGALAEGRLAGAERDAAVRHLASCRRCHEIFASTVEILEDEGVLPAVSDPAPSVVVPRRHTPVLWFAAAAAALVGVVMLLPRGPVDPDPRVATVSPTPVVTVSPVATPTPSPGPVQTAALPPEAIEALRTLGGFAEPYAVPRSTAFAPDPRKDSVRLGIEDIDRVARALAAGQAVPVPIGTVDSWRRLGRILEASRLALVAQPRQERFFTSLWVVAELEQAGRLLSETGAEDATWTQEVRRRQISDDELESLVDRLDRLLHRLA